MFYLCFHPVQVYCTHNVHCILYIFVTYYNIQKIFLLSQILIQFFKIFNQLFIFKEVFCGFITKPFIIRNMFSFNLFFLLIILYIYTVWLLLRRKVESLCFTYHPIKVIQGIIFYATPFYVSFCLQCANIIKYFFKIIKVCDVSRILFKLYNSPFFSFLVNNSINKLLRKCEKGSKI